MVSPGLVMILRICSSGVAEHTEKKENLDEETDAKRMLTQNFLRELLASAKVV